MDIFLASGCDLVTGSGVAALYSAADPEVGFGGVFAGGGLGLLLTLLTRLRNAAPFLGWLVRLVLSAAQFFALWEAKDSDVGAGLVVIPVFFLACCTPVGSSTVYLYRATLVSTVLNAVTLVAAMIHYGTNPETFAWESGHEPGVRKAVSVFNVAFAVAGGSIWASLARLAIFAALFAFPQLPRGLIHGPTPDWLLAMYGATLVQSTQVHATQLRIELSSFPGDTQRTLMFLVACALSVGYVERMGDHVNLSWVVLAVVVVNFVAWALQKKWLERFE